LTFYLYIVERKYSRKEETTVNAEIKARIQAHFTEKEVGQIEDFLNRGFSENGQIAVASIFLFVSECQKSVAEVLNECEKEWERNWQYQHPEIKGDADAPGAAGIQSRSSLENIYSSLGITSPLCQMKAEIPAKAITVTTRNSVYRFGEANQSRERTVSRDKKPLDFTRCKIVRLAIGQSMELRCSDGTHPNLYTSDVISIE
jgi:hypothetical protein